jgi:hypothetical protein
MRVRRRRRRRSERESERNWGRGRWNFGQMYAIVKELNG